MKRLLPILCLFIAGCGTPFGIGVSNALNSPVNQAIIAAASNAAAASLVQSVGGKANLSDAESQAANVATAAIINSVSSAAISGLSAALRTQQGTPNAANRAVIASTVAQAGVPNLAPAISAAVSNLSVQIPASKANESIAAALDAVAAKK